MSIEDRIKEFVAKFAYAVDTEEDWVGMQQFLEEALREQSDYYEGVIKQVIGEDEENFAGFGTKRWAEIQSSNATRKYQRQLAKQLLGKEL